LPLINQFAVKIAVIYLMIARPKTHSDGLDSMTPATREFQKLASLAIWETDAEGTVTRDSPSYRAYTGQTEQQWMQEGWIATLHPEEKVGILAQWHNAISNGESMDVELRIRSGEGGWRWINLKVNGVRDQHNNIVKWIGINADISDRKKAQQAQLYAEKQFRLLTMLSSDTLYKMNADWSLMVNLKGTDFLTDTLDANHNWLDEYIPQAAQQEVKSAIESAIASKSLFELEHQVFRADGSVGWAFSRAVPLFDEFGEITEWFGSARDTTMRKLAEHRQNYLLRLSDALLSVNDPVGIQSVSASLLGEHLGCEQSYYVDFGEASAEYVIDGDWYSSDLDSIAGHYPIEDWPMPWLVDGKTWVTYDGHAVSAIREAQLEHKAWQNSGASIVAPFARGGKLIAALVVNQRAARQWNKAEIDLVEETLRRTLATVERAKADIMVHENESRFKGQKEAFQAAIDGATLDVCLDLLVGTIVHHTADSGERAAFYILEEDGSCLHPVFHAGNMHQAYLQHINSYTPGTDPQPWELATATGRTVIIGDVNEKHQWAGPLDLASSFGIRGCWMFPVETQFGKVIGTFAMYFEEPRRPTQCDMSRAIGVAQAAAIIISRHHEVEQRKEAVDAVTISEKRLRLAIEATELSTWEWSLDTDEVLWNEQHFRAMGMEVEYKPQPSAMFLDHIYLEDRDCVLAELRRAIAEQSLYEAEFRIVRANDQVIRWMSGYGRVTETENGRPIRMSGAMFDITSRKNAEESLRRSEQYQRAILESAKDYAIITMDSSRLVTSWNAGAQAMLGYKEAEILGQSGDVFFVPEDLEKGAPEQEVQRAMKTGRAENERWHMRQDGSRFYGSGVTTQLSDDRGKVIGVLKVMRDLTVQKQSEQALEKSRERLQKALGIPTVGVIFFNEDGTLTAANDAFLTISGMSRESVSNRELNNMQMPLSEWIPRTQQAIEELKTTGRSTPFEKQLKRPDGSYWWGLFAGTQLSDTEYVEFVLDISFRKKAEEALLEADRRKDEFLALLAHELRNPMATLSNTLMVLEMTGGQGGILSLDAALAMMRREMTQLTRLADDLLDVSRINQGRIDLQVELIDFTSLVVQAVDAAKSQIDTANRHLTVALPQESFLMEADAARLTQVVRNLLTNATKFTQDGGHIWLKLSRSEKQAELRISDDGIGIPSDQLMRIFDLFAQVDTSRTRQEGGLGVGLALVREIVEKHDGQVEARSDGVGKGSEFIIHLPLLR
jgi:PAS domain S-box-containing protein